MIFINSLWMNWTVWVQGGMSETQLNHRTSVQVWTLRLPHLRTVLKPWHSPHLSADGELPARPPPSPLGQVTGELAAIGRVGGADCDCGSGFSFARSLLAQRKEALILGLSAPCSNKLHPSPDTTAVNLLGTFWVSELNFMTDLHRPLLIIPKVVLSEPSSVWGLFLPLDFKRTKQRFCQTGVEFSL